MDCPYVRRSQWHGYRANTQRSRAHAAGVLENAYGMYASGGGNRPCQPDAYKSLFRHGTDRVASGALPQL